MGERMINRLRKIYLRIVHSIAFYTLLISFSFLLLSWAMLMLDFSDFGRDLKSDAEWLKMNDASTARAITSTIAGAIIALTVFSFSMVMIILNQTASHISNRSLDTMIGNRFQQIVLGFFIGTIVYSLLLLTAIRDIDSGVFIPSLSVYLLILFTVVDIFLFIYFLHFVTQTAKYSTIIKRIRHKTEAALAEALTEEDPGINFKEPSTSFSYQATHTGFLQGFNRNLLLKWTKRNEAVVKFLHPVGTFIIKGNPILKIYTDKTIDKKEFEALANKIDFFNDQSPSHHHIYGFIHLSEIAIKALSPGVNDPSTAVLSLHALSRLLSLMIEKNLPLEICDEKNNPRIIKCEFLFEQMFEKCIYPIWHYGKNDPFIRQTMAHLLDQLINCDVKGKYHSYLHRWRQDISKYY